MTPQEESDQLPEEQPGSAGGSQDTPGNERPEADENEGGGDRSGDETEGQGTGNPGNAGSG
jgi:hypothetical protein